MKNLKEILFEKRNTVYTLFFGKNEPIEALDVKGTRFVIEFVDVIDCGKPIFNSNNMDEFAAPIFKEHYGREMSKEPAGKDGGTYYTYAAGDHSDNLDVHGPSATNAKITDRRK